MSSEKNSKLHGTMSDGVAQNATTKYSLWDMKNNKIWLVLVVLTTGLLLTWASTSGVKNWVDEHIKQEYNLAINNIINKIHTRLSAHAQLLRSGSAFIEASNSVERKEWHTYYELQRIEHTLPGIQGFGYSIIIPPNQLTQHEQNIRKEGFPEYRVKPAGKRETYTSIIYLEPFSGNNLRAFGYDMFSEPVRRKAMEYARDYDVASLTDKVTLVQETEKDVQAGTLMYVPVYNAALPVTTIDERRIAILGWVYNPYRMKDLMQGILGSDDLDEAKRIQIEIYNDSSFRSDGLLYNSRLDTHKNANNSPIRIAQSKIVFNNQVWYVRLSKDDLLLSNYDYSEVWIVAVGGILLTVFLCIIILLFINTSNRAQVLAEILTKDLKDSEEKYRVLFNNEIYAICIFDLTTLKLLDVNDAYARVYGYSREELLSMTIHDITAEHQASDAATTKATNEGTTFIPLRYHRKKNGITFPVEIVGGPYTWKGRNVMFALAHDITVRKTMEEALQTKNDEYEALNKELRSSVEKLQAAEEVLQTQNEELQQSENAVRESQLRVENIIAGTQVGTWEWNVQTGETIFNEKWAQIIGYTLAELTPISIKTWETYAHPDDLKQSKDLLEKHFSGDLPFYDFESRMKHKNGQWVWVHDRGQLITRTSIGKPLMMFGTHSDITERKLDGELLREAKETADRYLNISAEIIFSLNTQGIILLMNESGHRLLEYDPGELIGKNWFDTCIPKETRSEIWNIFQGLMLGDIEHTTAYENEIRTKNGNVHMLLWHNSLLKDTTGRIIGLLCSAQDITGRKKNEIALKESEERYRLLVENSPDIIYTYSNKRGGMYYSASIENILGYSAEHLYAHPMLWHESIHPEDRSRVDEIIGDFVAGNNFDIEYRIQDAARKWHWLRDRSIAREIGNDEILVEGLATDITARKLAENAAKESDQNFRTLANSGSTLVWASGTDTLCNYFNVIWLEFTGRTLEQEMGNGWAEGVHPDDLQRCLDIYTGAFDRREHFSMDYRLRRHDGEYGWIQDLGSPRYDSAGTFIGYLGHCYEITDRKRAEEELVESEDKYRGVVENSPIAIAIYVDGKIVFVNNECVRLMRSKNKEELIGKSVIQFVHPDNRAMVIERMKLAAIDGTPLPTAEEKFIRFDDTTVDVEVKAVPTTYHQKPAVQLIVQDITMRKNNEQALRQSQKLESIGTLAGGIAHDFNNLMNAVLGQSALALQKIPKESLAANNIQKAIKAGERVADLTKQLLAYSGRGKFFIFEIDLNTLVTENVQMLEACIPKTAKLLYELDSPSPHINGDISQIQQVIMNLIINAGEAIGSNPGFITVSTNRIEILTETNEYSKYTSTPLAAGSYAIVQVEDSGSGISEETLTRIFDPFFTTKFTGRGLGLAAVLGIIKGHKGGLRIDSKIGKGTTFEIVLPLVVPSKTTNAFGKKKLSVVNGEGKTILVIDDEASVIELLEDVLPEVNFKVICALDPLKGIEIYRRDHQNISLVVLDYSMPNMDGKAAFEELIKINKDVKVLLCSGYSEEETLSVFGLDRPAGYFQKPYDTEALLQKVEEIVSKDL